MRTLVSNGRGSTRERGVLLEGKPCRSLVGQEKAIWGDLKGLPQTGNLDLGHRLWQSRENEERV